MTRFRRRAHTRTNKYGLEYEVSETTVHRDNWDRSSGYHASLPQTDYFLDRYPVFKSSRRITACYINPNARCPVCGEYVFYYENEHGSRVFFDEIGPPWPKHRCTDTSLKSKETGIEYKSNQAGFTVRGKSDLRSIHNLRRHYGHNFEEEFRVKYGRKPWLLASISMRLKRGKKLFVVLDRIEGWTVPRIYLKCKSLPKCLNEGSVVAIGRKKLSFFNMLTMEPEEIATERIGSAAKFVDAVVKAGSTSN